MPFSWSSLLVVVSAFSVYLTAPRQQLLAKPLPLLAGFSIAVVLLIIDWHWRGESLAFHTYLFSLLTLLMLAWGLIPYAVVWIKHGWSQ